MMDEVGRMKGEFERPDRSHKHIPTLERLRKTCQVSVGLGFLSLLCCTLQWFRHICIGIVTPCIEVVTCFIQPVTSPFVE